MEVLSRYSKIVTIDGSEAISIPNSTLSLQETVPTVHELGTPCTTATRIFNFQLNPVLEFEMYLSDTFIETEVCVIIFLYVWQIFEFL